MKRMARNVYLILLIILAPFLFSIRPSLSETSDDPRVLPFSMRVQIDVAADEPMKSSLIDSLNGKLRSFDGVVLSETDPDYKLSVIAQPAKTKTGDMLGIIYFMAVTEPLNFEKSVGPVFGRKLGQEDLSLLKSMTSDQGRNKGRSIAFLPGSDLKELGETLSTDIAARFNKEVLLPAREAHQRISDALKKLDFKSSDSKSKSGRSGRKNTQRGGTGASP